MILPLGLAVFLSGCATVDLPGVNQQGFQVLDDEQRVFNRTAELNEQIDESGVLFEDRELEQYLTQVAQNLLPEQFNAGHIRLEVKLVKDPVINAYAMPTGRIYINTSMVALMDNEAQLCAVLAHELTHVLERHVLKMKRSTENKAAFFSTISLLGPITVLGEISAVTGFSQQIEYEADEAGFKNLVHTGYAPQEAVALFKRVKEFIDDEEIETPLFFSSHPGIKGRIANFEKLVAEEKPVSSEGKINADIFRDKTRRLKLSAVQQWINSGMFLTALAVVEDYLKHYPQDAEAYRLKGDILRKRVVVKEDPKRKDKNKEDFQLALTAYEDALRINPRASVYLRGKGIALQKLGRTDEALKTYQAYLTREPDAIDRQYFKGAIHGR